MEPCYILIPRHDTYLSGHDKIGCINKCAHLNEHIAVLKDGRIIKWEFKFCSECTECDPAEADCFVFNVITKTEALVILEKAYDNNLPKEVSEIINQLV